MTKEMQRLAKALDAFNAFTARHGGITPSIRAHKDSESYALAIEFETAQANYYATRQGR